MNDKIESLLKDKSYHQLDEVEKELVQPYFSKGEYERLHKLFRVNQEMQGEIPELPESTFGQIMNRQNQLISPKTPWTSFLSYRVPIWPSLILVGLCLVGLKSFLKPHPTTVIEKVKEVRVVDTVYIKVPVEVPMAPRKSKQPSIEKVSPKPKKKQIVAILDPAKALPTMDSLTIDQPLMPIAKIEQERGKGRNAKDVAKLLEVIVKVH